MCNVILTDIELYLHSDASRLVVFSGDFNINLHNDGHGEYARNFHAFLTWHHFLSAYEVRLDHNFVSYFNAALG